MAIRTQFHSRAMKRDMDELLNKIDRAGAQTALRAAKALRLRLAVHNPKLSGRSAASWNLTINQAIRSYQPESYNNPAGSPRDGIVQVEGYKLGDKLVISNFVPYLKKLEAGSSKQRPQGFISNCIAFIKAEFRAGTFSKTTPGWMR